MAVLLMFNLRNERWRGQASLSEPNTMLAPTQSHPVWCKSNIYFKLAEVSRIFFWTAAVCRLSVYLSGFKVQSELWIYIWNKDDNIHK